ncbi:MAG TPA: nuclear transport factor 2 family protein [Gemmatimonadaceae bacterium]|nr:nuclear transport factor 2 family protein [Gemmatimonadaceae bacterium]
MKPLKVLSLLMACGACSVAVNTANRSSGASEASLMQADREFADSTHRHGIDGWMSFFAPDAIRIRYRSNMVKGYDAVRAFDLPNISDTTVTLNWEPTDAYVFKGGDIGSTTGRYWAVSRKTENLGNELARGRYVTMWRRDSGRWLVIMDTGYPDPAPAK